MAKTRAYGADAQLLAAFETVYGTPPDGSGGGVYNKMLFKTSSLESEQPLGYEPLLGQGRDASDPFYEAITDVGDIEVPIDLQAIGFWLKGLFGDPATTDNLDGTYDHVFTSGAELPSLALEIGHTALTTPKFLMHQGCKLNTLAFDMSRSGPANATIGIVAQGETSSGAAQDATPNAFALTRFMQAKGAIKVGGAQLANVTAGRVSYSNNLDSIETIRQDGLIDGSDETEATTELQIDVRQSTDTTLTAAIEAKTPVAVEFGWTMPGVAGYALSFAFPRVFLPKPKNPINGPGGIQGSYTARAAKDATAGHMLQITLVNDVASY